MNGLTEFSKKLLHSELLKTGTDPSKYSNLTPLDLLNSVIYAKSKLTKDSCESKGFVWKQDTGLPYYCPENLKDSCTSGYCKIDTQDKCLKYSELPYDQSTGEAKTTTNNYLEWRESPDSTEAAKKYGCYLGNPMLRKWCELPKTRQPAGSDKDKLTYDANTGLCDFNKAYCDNHNSHWDESSKTCYKTSGEKFSEALFGASLTAIFEGNCKYEGFQFKPVKTPGDGFTKILPIAQNFAGPGITLYFLIRNSQPTVGFLAKELPSELVDSDNNIVISTADLASKYRRIYGVITKSPLIVKALELLKIKKLKN